ncbi:hypothetical protein ACU686_26680 [Yinghuangia aomiensis]
MAQHDHPDIKLRFADREAREQLQDERTIASITGIHEPEGHYANRARGLLVQSELDAVAAGDAAPVDDGARRPPGLGPAARSAEPRSTAANTPTAVQPGQHQRPGRTRHSPRRTATTGRVTPRSSPEVASSGGRRGTRGAPGRDQASERLRDRATRQKRPADCGVGAPDREDPEAAWHRGQP